MTQYTIYSSPKCSYCLKAKELLTMKGFDFEVIDLVAENISAADLSKKLGVAVRTVPQIVAPDGTYVGGYEDLARYLD